MKNKFNTPLLPNALKYLVSSKHLMTIKNVTGYFLLLKMNEDIYVFQPEDIDDKKITMNERKSSKRKFIEHVVFNTMDKGVSRTSVQKKENEFQTFKENLNTLLLKCYEPSIVNEAILLDMYIDSLNESEYLDLLKRLNGNSTKESKEIVKSLQRGGFVVTHGSTKYVYNHFEDKFFSFDENMDEADENVVIEIRDELKTITLNNTLYKGFSDLKNSELVLKLKTEREKSSGSICTKTSTFTIEILKGLIHEYNPFSITETNDNLRKDELCQLYDYILRLNEVFLRYPYYRHRSELNNKKK
jgi:hypothetical protein